MSHKQLTMQAFDKLNLDVKKLKILDVGCNSLDQSMDFISRGFEWTGSDMRPADGVVECKMEDMPFEDDSFDIVFASHSFEHCERPVEALNEFKRVVKKGGTIFISTPLYCEHQVLLGDWDHINVVTDLQMERLLKYVGLVKVSIETELNSISEIKAHSMITVAKHE